MDVFSCKRCGSNIPRIPGETEAVCDTCGKRQKVPKQKKRKIYDYEKEEKKRKILSVAGPVSVVLCIGFAILLITVIIPGLRYNSAVNHYNNGRYEEAIKEFIALQDYKDAQEQIIICKAALKEQKYNKAVELFNASGFEEAYALFMSLSSYKESAAYLAECEAAIREQKYQAASASLNSGDVIEVYESLMEMEGYKDSAELAKSIFDKYKEAKLKAADAGDTVYFGKYEQDNVLSNGKEDIEWIVLDKKDDKLFIISKYALDSHQYNETCEDMTWENCTLRKWLNDTFLNTAFDSEEQKSILTTTVKADENAAYKTLPGNDTTDKIYLLSIPEAIRYFNTGEKRMCIPTEYAVAKGAGVGDSKLTYGMTLCWWVLRSPGYYPFYVAYVYYSGYVSHYGYEVSLKSDAVRPVLWIQKEN